MSTTNIDRGRRTRLPLAILALALLGSALAQDLTIDLGTAMDRRNRPVLAADVHQGDGKPVTSRAVSFYLIPDFFPNAGERLNGGHRVLLGTAKTNIAGHAETLYTAPYTGTVTIVAEVAGASGAPGGSGQAEVDLVREHALAPPWSPSPLAAVVGPFQSGVLIAVLALWVVLLGLLALTVGRVMALGRGAPRDRPGAP